MASDGALSVDVRVRGEHPERPRLELAFRAPPGITTLFGPSGSGKSTCLMAIAGLVRPERGRITLGERTLFDHARRIALPPRARRVALVFQSLALFPHLSSLDNVVFGIPRALPEAERVARAHAWLARMRIGHVAERRPTTLSGGEAQRVALARALASSPTLLLLDEPFSALDAPLRRELIAEIAAVVEELAVPALLVTHHADEVSLLGGQLIQMEAGRLA